MLRAAVPREPVLKRILIGTVLALAAASSALAADGKADRKYVDLYNRLASTVADRFYDPGLNGSNWTTVVRHYRTRLKSVRTDAEFERLGVEMLKELATDGAELHGPDGSDSSWTGVGVQAWRMGRDLVITRVGELSDARRQGLKPGEIILSERLQLVGPAGSAASLRVRGCDGAERLVTVRREEAFAPLPRPAFRWSRLTAGEGRTIGYIRVDAFEDDAAELADRAMADLAGSDALILDLRHADSGNGSALRLASYFIEGAQPGFSVLSREWIERRGVGAAPDARQAPRVSGAYTDAALERALQANGGAATLWTEDVGTRRYARPVILLQGEHTGGVAEAFARLMQLKSPAVIMGRKTSGRPHQSASYDLGDGWSVSLPVRGVWAADGGDYAGRPVAPTVVVPTSRASMCAGRDADLEAAVDRITGARPAV